jgi:hypothetical protein
MKSTFKLYIGLTAGLFIFDSCKKDDPVIPNEEEVITTMTYTLSPVGGGNDVVLSFQDLDGEGGNSPVLKGGNLEANKTYTGKLLLLNEIAKPAENISAEISEEDIDHQFFFTTNIAGISIEYSDKDKNGKPLGLLTKFTTKAAGKGALKVTLRHKLNKMAERVEAGDITNAAGETDLEVSIDINVL